MKTYRATITAFEFQIRGPNPLWTLSVKTEVSPEFWRSLGVYQTPEDAASAVRQDQLNYLPWDRLSVADRKLAWLPLKAWNDVN